MRLAGPDAWIQACTTGALRLGVQAMQTPGAAGNTLSAAGYRGRHDVPAKKKDRAQGPIPSKTGTCPVDNE
ncbi:hypothetical protein XAP412_570016 [Xanthomonas phaseoli pv. phaseoli]|uniref:Transposase n=1 Tax=Xanthomonas campestris pv. phaseoli TaxID=317013 RepID=A0AB38E4Z1_XANCH|nr:hypothetical protein XAP6984_1450023 [Xanthomonas phaseoli pv. phaseoli]SON88042.1 hypothetical protein XAP412_570016 [Xanthomonas phaseoli pv. phaseoli]SON91502.1 hypothetical protein XAP7430_580016 [Xanthomonas phaseoli pv. phaseoli]SOO28703.1 hypothetical protein XAP6164_2630003 [Xanthomonas phaseoli pv. phaseoli]